ncbi:hypothetical protein RNJ44_01194 [Nakaseomyces bracarensis]|uniref:mitogen-activated protein kinase kinase n=1 Tax=Nakaseomyces bracarensis TaxID=273131 RepID=A0ABR4NR64_9SACH
MNRHSVAGVNDAMERMRIEKEETSVKRASSMSSNYSNINASLHARVKAFQEQRGLHRSSSLGKSDSEETLGPEGGRSNSGGSISFQQNNGSNGSLGDRERDRGGGKEIHKIVNKPLPPLPPGGNGGTCSGSAGGMSSGMSSMGAVGGTSSGVGQGVGQGKGVVRGPVPGFLSDRRGSQISPGTDVSSSSSPFQGSITGLSRETGNVYGRTPLNTVSAPSVPALNPNRKAPKAPMIPHNTVIPTQQMPSLSARRGLKLPPGGMSLKLPSKGDAPSMPSTVTAPASLPQAQHQEFAATPSNKNHIKSGNGNGKRSNPGSLVNAVQSTSTSSSTEESHDTEGTETKSNSNPGGLFANFSRYVDIKSGSLNFAGKLSLSSRGIDFSNGSSSRITLSELQFIEELGHGNYGTVSKVLHKPNNVLMAMKEVRLELDEAKFRQILMELEVLHKCKSPYIVDFYGAFFIEGAVYMCMEYMDGGSLDKIYDENPEMGGIDEPQLAFITYAVIQGLRELKEVHNVIHRDVKPTNILCSAKQGTIKLCDFGVSGNLVASLAKTNIGCQSYMAPERIKSLNPDRGTYTVQSDIWSLGLSILEMALGRYPYPPETFDNIFSQLSAIVDGPPPRLPDDRFSEDAQDFVSLCLQKIPDRRPNYANLSEHPWLVKYRKVDVKMGDYISKRLEIRSKILAEKGEDGLHRTVPALHRGGL